MASIRDQISSLTIAQLEAGQLSQVAGKVYMSANAVTDQGTAQQLTETWRAVHAPTYGQPIPSTGTTASTVGDTVLFGPSTNQTAYINAIDFTNADPTTPATVELTINGVSLGLTTVPALSTVSVIGIGGIQPFMLANGHNLSQSITGVPPASVTGQVAYCLTVQG